jgi:hypothetical protein
MPERPTTADEVAFVACVVVVVVAIGLTALNLGWMPPSLGPDWLDLAC